MNENKARLINELFGGLRAEWIEDKIFQFFTTPDYFSNLQSKQPYVLQGGRGSGKTTILRGLSYLGQYALKGSLEEFDKEKFIGIYHRVNTNHVRAFEGGNLTDQDWQKLYAHYFNLVICREIVDFLLWHRNQSPDDEVLSERECKLVSTSLCLENKAIDIQTLADEIELSMYEFQSSVNSIDDGLPKGLSMQAGPIDLITERVLQLKQFKGKLFFLLVDEYENLNDNQQIVMNTLLKHASRHYTFKIGVRQMGWRVHYTQNDHEPLREPEDYYLHDIEDYFYKNEQLFMTFAAQVCRQRLEKIQDKGDEIPQMNELLPSLPYEDEAILLDVEHKERYLKIKDYLNKEKIDLNISPLYLYTLGYWAETQNMSIEEVVKDYQGKTTIWDTRYDNYKYSLLFKIRKGRGQVGIQKYYAGWSTFLKLSNGNIRYLMSLVKNTLLMQLNITDIFLQPITAKVQTEAAIEVGKKYFMMLENLHHRGADLIKIVLNMGRLFNVLASESEHTAPEIDQFYIQGDITAENDELLRAGVMHLAFIRIPGNKPSSKSDTKDYMYALHPIFAPYFIYSFRRKRKMTISNEDFYGLILSHKSLMKKMLSKDEMAKILGDNDQPQQMDLFANLSDD